MTVWGKMTVGGKVRAVLIACGLLAAATPAGVAVAGGDGHEAVLVVGFPRSMWIEIEGQAKAAILKKTLGRVLPTLEGRFNLGVEAFGSTGSGCEDITKARDVGPIDPVNYAKGIEALKPKGSTPLAAAIEHANGMFDSDGNPKTIIVVTDSVDSCKGDPCATAAALRQGPNATSVHVIAFDRHAKEKLKSLSCMAENGKGSFATAVNEAELETALKNAFAAVPSSPGAAAQQRPASPLRGGPASINLTNLEDPGAAPSNAQPDEPETPAPSDAPPAAGDPAPVTLSALLAQGTPPLTSQGLVWRIFEGKARDDGSYRLLQTLREPNPTLKLNPGRYLVNVAFGKSNVTKRIDVWPSKPTQDNFILGAGGMRLYATLNKTQVIPDNLVSFDIYSEETDQSGNRIKIVSKGKPGVIFRLNSGAYHVASSYGDCNAIVESEVKVEAGKLAETKFDHDAARITFRLVDHPGGEALADTSWTIATRAGETVKESWGAFPSHILAAGAYKVTARHGSVDYVQEFVVKGAENKQVEVVAQ